MKPATAQVHHELVPGPSVFQSEDAVQKQIAKYREGQERGVKSDGLVSALAMRSTPPATMPRAQLSFFYIEGLQFVVIPTLCWLFEVDMYVRMYVRMHHSVSLSLYIYICTHTHTPAYNMYMYVYIYIYVYIYVYVYVCMILIYSVIVPGSLHTACLTVQPGF